MYNQMYNQQFNQLLVHINLHRTCWCLMITPPCFILAASRMSLMSCSSRMPDILTVEMD